MTTNANSSVQSNWLSQALKSLENAGIGTARLDCLVLLEDATGKDRAWLLAHPEYQLQVNVLKTLNKQITQRAKHIPLAYLRGKTEFYGREFTLSKDVLEPRPESETMIDLLKGLPLQEPSILDLGTGSGAIGITAALEIPRSQVSLSDIDPACLKIAKKNAKQHGVTVEFLQGDLLNVFGVGFDFSRLVILANLPYVPDHYKINEAALMEPRIAIFGGHDGLDLYRKLFAQITKLHTKPAYILTESLPFQHEDLCDIAEVAGYHQNAVSDFIQLFTYIK